MVVRPSDQLVQVESGAGGVMRHVGALPFDAVMLYVQKHPGPVRLMFSRSVAAQKAVMLEAAAVGEIPGEPS